MPHDYPSGGGSGVHIDRRDLSRLVRKLDQCNEEMATFMREGLLAAAELVRRDAEALYAPKSVRGAAGLKAKVTRPGNAIVAQTLRRSRGSKQRANFGGLMMRTSLLPALESNQPRVEAMVGELLQHVERLFDD